MSANSAVIFSFCLYILYVLLPLIPAILIFRLFPDTKVSVSGPLQNLTLNATGAFAAYVVTVALGFFLVQNVEEQIAFTRYYPVEGVIANLGENEGINSDRIYSRYSSADAGNGNYKVRDYAFVLLLNHPVLHPETVLLNYWGNNGPAGAGSPPPPKTIALKIASSSTSPQRFRIENENGQPVIVPETSQVTASK